MVSICFILSTFLYLISFISSTQSVNVDNINRSSDQPRIESENSDHTRDYLKKINKLTIQSPAKKNVLRARSLQTSGTTNNKKPVSGYAAYLELKGGIYYGVEAIMDVWAPHVDNSNETSESLIRLRIENSAYGPNYSFISVGWQVNPKLYGDNATRLTIVWEKYRSSDDNWTYCYNVMCKPVGFVQTNNTIRLGDKFSTISSYGEKGPHFAFPLSVYKDSQTKHWWLEVNKIAVGYWPSQLFSDNKNVTTAAWVQLGGQVTTTTTNLPKMGSGHFPNEGYGKAACIQAIQAYRSMDRKDPEKPLNSSVVTTNPDCYGLKVGKEYKAYGNYFYYGGPGGNKSSCE